MPSKTIYDLQEKRIIYGCMNIGGSWNRNPLTLDEVNNGIASVETALECGINFFDHADIYTMGKSEEVFAYLFKQNPSLREKIILQSKCGIRFPGYPEPNFPGRYDFSYSHIVTSAENALRRLGTERLDIYLLHRPDPLMEPEEVARAFNDLKTEGKVDYFGVSNHSQQQIEYLQCYLPQPLVANQMEFNLIHCDLINAGVTVNQPSPEMNLRTSGLIDYCRMKSVTIQAYSPVAKGKLSNQDLVNSSEYLQKLRNVIMRLAEKYDCTLEAIMIAWILRHPAKIQPVIGTTNRQRIRDSVKALSINLTREEWYSLFIAGRGANMP